MHEYAHVAPAFCAGQAEPSTAVALFPFLLPLAGLFLQDTSTCVPCQLPFAS